MKVQMATVAPPVGMTVGDIKPGECFSFDSLDHRGEYSAIYMKLHRCRSDSSNVINIRTGDQHDFRLDARAYPCEVTASVS